MTRTTLLGISHSQSHGIFTSATELYCRQLANRGYDAQLIDLADPAAARRINQILQQQTVAFAFGLHGIGARLEDSNGENLWLAARVPFLCLHHDSPCANPLQHTQDSPYVANMYFVPSHLEQKQRYLPGAQISALLPLELLEITDAPRLPFADRPIRILYLKNGAPLEPLEDALRALPPSLHDGARDQLARAERSPNLDIGVLTQEIFDQRGLDRDDQPGTFWSIAQTMEIWLRRKRAITFVNWLKDQDGAVIIGGGWECIDRDGARARFQPAVPARNTRSLYAQAQFIGNTSPYGRDVVHERILYGLLMGGCVLSDSNAWLDQTLESVPALTRFKWNQPLDAQLLPVLNDPATAAQNAATGRDAIIARYKPDKLIDVLIDSARQIATTLEQFAQEKSVV